MTPEQWRQVEALYDAVVMQSPVERAALLAAADAEVRRLTEALLAEPRLARHTTLAGMTDTKTAEYPQTPATSLNAGSAVGPYRVEGLLGRGGMATVYRATDTRLGRHVAIKICDERFSARFQREAQSIAALNHPNICTLYDVGPNYLVMELLEGETLAARLKHGPLPPKIALQYAAQIADAFTAAHETGITHRDLKPGNVMITKSAVKVLDFGLAKMRSAGEPLTESHVVMGTPLYMAPEQLEGKECDSRTDLYALGLLLYECLQGKPLQQGQTPIWIGIPNGLRHVLGRCLEREPDDRWQTARDLRAELNWAATENSPPSVAQPSRNTLFRWGLAIVLTLALVAGGVYWLAQRHSLSSADTYATAGSPVLDLTLDLGHEEITSSTSDLAVSPDGTRIVFRIRGPQGKSVLATRLLDQRTVIPLLGTDDGRSPFFSPDGKWIAFSADRKLKKISVYGGPPRTICDDIEFAGGSWGEDNQIVAATGGFSNGLQKVDAAGGTPQLILKPSDLKQLFFSYPQILPGGDTVLFTATNIHRTFENGEIEAFSFSTGKWKTLQARGYFGRYLPSGHLVWVRGRTLFGAPFDPVNLELKGPAVPLIEHDLDPEAGAGAGNFDFSRNGLFVHLPAKSAGYTVVWMDSKGGAQQLIADPGDYRDATLSPDGKRLLLSIGGSNRVIYTFDIERRVLSRLSFLQQTGVRYPVWSSDGRHVAFIANEKTNGAIWWMRSDGSGQPHRLYNSDEPVNRFYFSPDTKTIVIEPSHPQTATWVSTLDLTDPDRPQLEKTKLFMQRSPQSGFSLAFSPDGRWVAYSNVGEQGETGLFVRSADLSNPARWQITSTTDKYPVWSRTSNQLFFQDRDYYIQVADYTVKDNAFVPGKPRRWLDKRFSLGSRFFDLAADSKHIVALVPVRDNPNLQVTFKVNFFDEVRRRARRDK